MFGRMSTRFGIKRQVEGEIDKLKAQFISELRLKYEQIVEAVYPVPFIAEKVKIGRKIFIDCGIDFLQGSWKTLDSHHGIFKQANTKGDRLVIEGGPGFGKSTVALQFLREWYKAVNYSLLSKVDILIFLRLRQLAGVKSIHAAIKKFILSRGTLISEERIKQILEASSSVVIILDGFDEYPGKGSEDNLDITKIMTKDTLQKYTVILTGRWVPTAYVSKSYRFKLTGFNAKAQEEYILQATKERHLAQKVLFELKKNDVLNDLCEVPLFFVMFVHIYLESDKFEKLISLTSLFQLAMKTIVNHAELKLNDANVQKITFLKDQSYLERIAFDGFKEAKYRSTWKKEDLLLQLPTQYYDQYVNVGILVEEVWDSEEDEPWIEVRFFHRLFQEWYAAHYVANYAKEKRTPSLESILKSISTRDFQYLYRFACGVYLEAADAIIKCVKKSDKWLAALCYQEQILLGGVDKEFLTELCTKSVVQIEKDHSKLFKKHIKNLLKRASGLNIPIVALWLIDCFDSLVPPENHTPSDTDIFLPELHTLKEMRIIWTSFKVMTSEDVIKALKYAKVCIGLQHLGFSHCLLPKSFPASSLRQIGLNNIEVEWNPSVGNSFLLDLSTGKWTDKKTGKQIMKADYKSQERVRNLAPVQ